MSIKRAFAIALLAAAALPASAAGQAVIPPPQADNYLDSHIMNGGDPMVTGDSLGIIANTTSYTLQEDMFVPAGQPAAGGPREPRLCTEYNPDTPYGNTVWAAFRSRDYGVMELNASSGNFDEVIRVVPFESLTDAAPILPGGCYDDFKGFSETARGLVFPGNWYAVQVGGTINDTSNAQGGSMQLKFDLRRPPNVSADALLFWKKPPLRVTSLTVQGVTRGAKITLTCTKGACKKATRTASKPFWSKPVSAVGPTRAGVRMKNATGSGGSGSATPFKRIATAAKTKFTLLKNRKVKKGQTITVRVTAPGFVGRHFFWRVKSGELTSKKVSCMNPGSSKPRKPGTCHG
jgi:hypothetical protein